MELRACFEFMAKEWSEETLLVTSAGHSSFAVPALARIFIPTPADDGPLASSGCAPPSVERAPSRPRRRVFFVGR